MGREGKKQSASEDRAPRLNSETGATSEGVPLAFNREPDERLRHWVSRSMVAVASEAESVTLKGLLCNDSSYLRSAVGVDWVAGTADGPLPIRDETFLCGQHSKVMPLSYRGGIKVAGLMLRPGALHLLFGLNEAEMVDRIQSIDSGGVRDGDVTGLYSTDPTEWLRALENWMADFIAENDIEQPDPLSQALELQAFADPNCILSEFAERHGVSPRTVERTARRDFGLRPKQIMRRARILDLAARLCGVADEEEVEIMLRFFDQAHQIREFHAFFGMTPVEFKHRRSGLLTLSLEIRQARRLELLERIEPGSVRPWMRKPFLAAAAPSDR